MLSHLMQFQKTIKGRLESTHHRLSLEIGDERQKLTVNWTTWLYIDCCCETYPTGQWFPIVTVFRLRH